jgi:L-ribulose-5-phosphate 3-epimerase
MKTGVIVDSFRLPLRESIIKAAEIGAQGIQIYAVSGEMATENLSKTEKREILQLIKDNGLVISALCGDLGGHGFEVKDDNPKKIERSKKIIELAKEFETDVVTTHIGVIPSSPSHDRYKILLEACQQLGEYADEIGSSFAIETGPERNDVLKNFLDRLSTDGVKVNYDPANLVMVTGEDPVEGVFILRDYIVHTHAKDGIMLKQTNPETIYHFFAEGGIGDLRLEEYFKECPLGQGNVNFDPYVKALNEIGYQGFLTIERELGENPEKDIIESIAFLKKYVS